MLDANGAPSVRWRPTPIWSGCSPIKSIWVTSGCRGAVRSRVFGDENGKVACLYVPLRPAAPEKELVLPEGVELLRAEGADGRPLAVENGRIPVGGDGVVYLYFADLPERLLDRNTRAMPLYRAARDYRPAPRCRKPVVIQPDYDLGETFYSGTGIRFGADGTFRCRVRYNNLSGRPVTVEPGIELPRGIVAPDFPAAAFELGPNGSRMLEFTLRATDDLGVARHSLVRLGDRRGNTTPLAVALHRQPSPEHVREGRLSGLPEMENPASWRKNSAGELTIRRDETDRSIEFRTRFPVGVDRWSYPEFVLPPGVLKDAIAVGFEVKVTPGRSDPADGADGGLLRHEGARSLHQHRRSGADRGVGVPQRVPAVVSAPGVDPHVPARRQCVHAGGQREDPQRPDLSLALTPRNPGKISGKIVPAIDTGPFSWYGYL